MTKQRYDAWSFLLINLKAKNVAIRFSLANAKFSTFYLKLFLEPF